MSAAGVQAEQDVSLPCIFIMLVVEQHPCRSWVSIASQCTRPCAGS